VTWIEPVFDRTQADVEYAMRQMAEWRATGKTNTFDLKGCLNVNDINRIENNIAYLATNLSSLYYFSVPVTKTWERTQIPTSDDVDRILNNVRELNEAFYQSPESPPVPDGLFTISQVNDLEENLYQLKTMLDNMISSFKQSGAFECGEE
jgi:hypothetical protein